MSQMLQLRETYEMIRYMNFAAIVHYKSRSM